MREQSLGSIVFDILLIIAYIVGAYFCILHVSGMIAQQATDYEIFEIVFSMLIANTIAWILIGIRSINEYDRVDPFCFLSALLGPIGLLRKLTLE